MPPYQRARSASNAAESAASLGESDVPIPPGDDGPSSRPRGAAAKSTVSATRRSVAPVATTEHYTGAMNPPASLVLLLAVAPLLGCATTVKSGVFGIDQDYVDRDFPQLKRRAAFNLNCPEDQISLVTLAAVPEFQANRPTQVGADGCGHRAVYVKRPGEWLMNSSSATAK